MWERFGRKALKTALFRPFAGLERHGYMLHFVRPNATYARDRQGETLLLLNLASRLENYEIARLPIKHNPNPATFVS